MERRKAYCCFDTRLARMSCKRIRLQPGHAWASANNPDCIGIEVGDLAGVDWSRVDLDGR